MARPMTSILSASVLIAIKTSSAYFSQVLLFCNLCRLHFPHLVGRMNPSVNAAGANLVLRVESVRDRTKVSLTLLLRPTDQPQA